MFVEIETQVLNDFIKIFIISLYTQITSFKILNIKNISKVKIIISIITIFLFGIIYVFIKDYFNVTIGIMIIDILLSILFSINTKNKFGYSMLIITLSISINYILYTVSVSICFFISLILEINNKILNIIVIIAIYTIILSSLTNIRKIKYGITFLIKNKENEFFEILILNISATIFCCFIILSGMNLELAKKFFVYIIIFSIIMFVTIQKSLQLYYKQKMLVKDLEETKEELEEKNNKIKELEKEIIKSGKRSHSISHRQKILEHKLEELSMKSEISEMDIKSRIEKIGKDIRKEPVIVLAKTGIVEIDDVLNYMKSECLKKKIDFQLQLSGNIYKMINNYVSKDELEILLADHIKNAIIAIEHSENINKSILVRLGRLDGTYGLYVYDSGIEFEIETFLKLGKKPATTHKDSGGTGMGFMNTFDTLRKHNASFIIEEYGKPVTDNFTKVLKFKFDNKNEFKICTYRKEEIEKQDKEKILKVENLMF